VIIMLARRRPSAMAFFERNWAWLFTLSWLVVPLAAVLLLSLTYKPLIVIRYLMVCVPPAAILVGAVIARALEASRREHRSARLAALVCLAVLLAGSLVGTVRWYQSAGPQDWRSTVAYVGRHAQPGDGVLFVAPYVRIPFEWYVGTGTPASAKLHPVYPSLGWGIDPMRFDSSVSMSEGAVARAASGYSTVWLVQVDQRFTPQQERAVLAALKQDGFSTAESRTFPGVTVLREIRTESP